MNETLGTLSFQFRALRDQWRNDLAEMDREYLAYRQKWETPVRVGAMAGAGVGGGGGGGFGGAGGTVSRGPSIVGTSNGDVTFKLADAVRQTQVRTYGVGGGRMRGLIEEGDGRAGDVADEFVQQGRIRMELGNARELSRRSRVLEEQQDKFDELKSAHEGSLGYKLRQPVTNIRGLIRTTVVGLVAEAALGMGAAEAEYGRNMTLAGSNTSQQARAVLQLRKGVLGSVPLVGGMLNSINTMATAGIETDLDMTDRQVVFGDERYGALMGRGYANRAADVRRLGLSAFGGRAIAGSLNEVTAIRSKFAQESQAAREKFMGTLGAEPERPLRASYRVVTSGLQVIDGQEGYDAALRSYNTAMADRRKKINDFNEQQNSILSSRLGLNQASLDEQLRGGLFNIGESEASLGRLRGQNAFQPYAAEAGYIYRTTMNRDAQYGTAKVPAGYRSAAEARRALSGKPISQMADDEKAFYLDFTGRRNNLEMGIEEMRGQQQDIKTNYLYGHGQEFNPFVQSTDTFMDRSPETQAAAYQALTDAINNLRSVVEKVAGGN